MAHSDACPDPVAAADRLFLYLCGAAVLGFLVWAGLFRLDIVSEADGEVVPSTKVKRVEHLEGGIVREILVREGDLVSQDQPLVILESTTSDSNVEELSVRINSLRAEVARLEAEDRDLPAPVFPADLEASAPALVRQALDVFEARRRSHAAEAEGQRERIKQRSHEISEISARIRNSREGLKLLQERIAISGDLLKDGLTSKYKHLAFLQDESKLKSSIEEDGEALARARAGLAGEESKLEQMRNAWRETARADLQKVGRELEELTQRLRKFQDSQNRTVIRSPEQGLVKSLYVASPGEVVKAGETILDLVPAGDRLVVEAHLPVSEIGYVATGQEVIVKLASRDASRYGRISGTVAGVSPDTITDSSGRTFYRVRVETDQDRFESAGRSYRLYPGVRVVAGIHIGRRTVLAYLLEPFFTAMGRTLQER